MAGEAALDLTRAGADNDEIEVSGDRGDNFTPTEPTPTPTPPPKPELTPTPDPEPTPDPAPDPAPDPEPTPEPAPAPKPAAQKSGREKWIPRERFDEVIERRRALEKRVQELEAAQKAPAPAPAAPVEVPKPAVDIDALEVEYGNLLLDGKVDEAKAVRQRIREAERAALAPKTDGRDPAVTREMIREEIRLQDTIEQLEAEYPVFNNKSDQADPDLIQEVLTLQAGYIEHGGLSPSAALRKAARMVAKANDIAAIGEEAPPADPEPAPPTPQPTPAQRQKKLELATKQPTEAPQRGRNEPTQPSVAEMSDEEFDALPESKKRALRGDSR